jgi:4-hydroxy-tetrahydrodipicolinate reductase
MINVLVIGAAGRMGQTVCRTVLDDSELSLVDAVDVASVGKDIGEVLGSGNLGVPISDNLSQSLESISPDVVVDFTHPNAVMNNIRTVLGHNIDMVVGTTGITEDNLEEIKSLLKTSKSHIFIAPNFAIGAVLMMKFAELAAKHFDSVEIIELHHDKKADAPSGTALKTAEIIAESSPVPVKSFQSEQAVQGARGGEYKGIHIHSIRLPGLVAHQEVIFGGAGQTLTIRHDSIDRSSFMPGVILAIKNIHKKEGLTHGLDKLLGL